MERERIIKLLIWLLFCSITMTAISAYVYIKYWNSMYMLAGFCLCFSSDIDLSVLIYSAVIENKVDK